MRLALWLAVFLWVALSAVSSVSAEGVPCSAEPTDMVITYGSVVTCALEVSGDTDLFRFSGSAGEAIVVHANSTVRPCLELIAPDNSRITECPNAFTARIDTTLTQTGTYTIVAGSTFDFTGDYVLVLERFLPASPGAAIINYGGTVTTDIGPAGDLDLFIFGGTAGDIIRVSAASNVRPCLELVAPDNSRIRECPNAFSAQIDTTLGQTGTYTIVAGSTFDFTGDLNLTLQCFGGGCVNHPPVTGSVDHYKCYSAANRGSPFRRREVTLDDEFDSKHTRVVRPVSFCNPVSKNGEPIHDPATRLTCYQITDVPGQPRFVPRTATTEDQFGEHVLAVSRPSTLCLPSSIKVP